MFKRIIIGLGSNLADPTAALPLAWRCVVEALPLKDAELSTTHTSRPAEGASGPQFANAVGAGRTDREPADVMALLQAIERAFGRDRLKPVQGRQRPLDLDLLDHEGQRHDAPELMLPHPRLAQRDFVLKPLIEIAADFVDVRSGLSAVELLARLPDQARTLSLKEGPS